MRRTILSIVGFLLIAAAPAWAGPSADDEDSGVRGAVYAMTNAEAGNAVLVYDRIFDGGLRFLESNATGGLGFVAGTPIDPLRSQGSLVLSEDARWLLAVNAGSDEVSVFRVKPRGLQLTDVVASGGILPVSVTIHQALVYVLHAGGSLGDADRVTGFRLSPHGILRPIPGSTRSLSLPSTDPAQIAFTPDGSKLIVTEKGTNRIDVFLMDRAGLPSDDPVITQSEGSVPFGFVFNQQGALLVSEAAGSVSSYRVRRDGRLDTLSAAIANGQVATCWITGDGRRHVFTANTGSNTLSRYSAVPSGKLTLLEAAAVTVPGTAPIDLAMSKEGRYIYSVNALTGTVGIFEVHPEGTVESLGNVPGLPVNDGAQGIAAR